MSALLATAALGAAGNLAGGTISTLGQLHANKQNVDLAKQQMQWNEQMMDKQNQQELDFWNKQNEYNSPAEQVKRMQEAGLYPGDTTNTPAQALNAASPLGYQNPNVQNPYAGLGLGVQQAAMAAAQIENIKADTASKNAATMTEDELRDARKESIIAETDKNRQQLKNLGLEEEQMTIMNRYLDEKQQLEIATMQKSIDLTDAQINEINKRIDKYDKEIEEMNARIDKINADELLTYQQINESIALVNEYNALIGKIATETNLNSLDIEYYITNHDKSGFFNTGLNFSNLDARGHFIKLDNGIRSIAEKVNDKAIVEGAKKGAKAVAKGAKVVGQGVAKGAKGVANGVKGVVSRFK